MALTVMMAFKENLLLSLLWIFESYLRVNRVGHVKFLNKITTRRPGFCAG